jgi:membrane protease subunit HflK
MPWNNQSGGGGPWKPGNQGPWGQGPSGGNNNPPDLEELLRRGQDKLRQAMRNQGSDLPGPSMLIVFLVLALGAWLASGFYTVAPNEVGLNMVFGRFDKRTTSGLNYNWPYPIGSVTKLGVTDRNGTDIGFITRDDTRRLNTAAQIEVPEESLMLTGDENIADVKFRVIWQIDPMKPEDYAFNVRNPPETVKAVAESAMREIVGRTPIQRILTAERKVIEPAAQELIQKVLNDYRAGVLVLQVQLLSVDPPEQVIAAFRDVTAAQQDQDRLRNEAEAYANRVVPEARGAAERIKQEAEGYREQTVAEARGQASRFDQIYAQYKNAPAVTRERLYIEAMERVLASSGKIIIDQQNGQGVVPYLPLGQIELPKSPAPSTQGPR